MRKKEFMIGPVLILTAILTGYQLTGLFNAQLGEAKRIQEQELQEHLAKEVLRFHILANSDSVKDQELKVQVKEGVLDWMEQTIPDGLSGEETREWMRSHTQEITELSELILEDAGEKTTVQTAVTTCYFPQKTYGDLTFPAGNYEALRIEIGQAKGHNWWCVLYPNLCFLDGTCKIVPKQGKENLKQVVTEEEYEWITTGKPVKAKSYILEQIRMP